MYTWACACLCSHTCMNAVMIFVSWEARTVAGQLRIKMGTQMIIYHLWGTKILKPNQTKKNHEVLEQFRTRGWEQLPQIYLRITWSRARRPHSQQLCQRFKRWYLNRGASRFRKDSCTGRQEVKIGYLGWKGKSRIGMKGPADRSHCNPPAEGLHVPSLNTEKAKLEIEW